MDISAYQIIGLIMFGFGIGWLTHLLIDWKLGYYRKKASS